jgi:glycosyltransferase involved in cell wall biosynthesis
MPVRDGLPYLGEALASVLGQTHREFELVAVDDGSTDGSGELLDAHAAGDPRVRVLHTSPAGVSAALNVAVEAATGELLARMDADDISHPERFERQLAHLRAHPDDALVACRAEAHGDHAGSGTLRLHAWQSSLMRHEQMMADLFVDAPFPHDAVMMRRSALSAAGGYQDHPWPEDFDLWHRMARAGQRFAKVPEVLLAVRDHPGRVTRTRPEASGAALLRARVHHLLLGPLSGTRSVVVWGAGKVGKRMVRALGEADVKVVAIVDLHPRKIGRVIHGASVIAPEELPALSDLPVLAAVGKPGARADIRRRCGALGLPPPLAVA